MENIWDIIPEEEKKSLWWKVWAWIGSVVWKSMPIVADVAEELGKGVVKSVPKFWTFIWDTIINGVDIWWDVLAEGTDFLTNMWAEVMNEVDLYNTWTKWTKTWTNFWGKEWFLDKLNAVSDEATTAMDAAVDEFFEKPVFNQMHALDDSVMKDIIWFTWEMVWYYVSGRWVTVPAKMVFAGKNVKQAKELMKVIAKNKQIMKAKWLAPAVGKEASAAAKEAKVTLDWLVKSGQITMKDPKLGYTAGNLIGKWVGDSKFINKLVAIYDKAFGKWVWLAETAILKNPVKTWAAALWVWAMWLIKKNEWEEWKEWEEWDVTETLSTEEPDISLIESVVSPALWNTVKNIFGKWVDWTTDKILNLKERFSALWEWEQEELARKIAEWNSKEAKAELSRAKVNLQSNIELPWLLDWENIVYYNWLEWNIWSMKDWAPVTLDEDIQSYNDAELAEWNMSDYVQVYYQ